MNDVLNLINDELLAIADPEKANGMKAYMKDKFDFLGVSSPERKVISRFVWQENKQLVMDDWRELFIRLWDAKAREFQYIALDLMDKVKRKVLVDDIGLIESFITEKSWWDTVDFVASNLVGQYFEKYQDERMKIIPNWMQSEDIWLNRTAIIFQLKYKEKVDFELLKENILFHLGSDEFFINKASGWALRQYSKFNPEEVRHFIDDNPTLSKLTIKEASKYI